MCKTIAVINHKGGVGKTTTVANLGKALSLLGKKTLLIDFDPQANLTHHYGIDSDENDNIENVILRKEKLPLFELSETLSIVPGSLELAIAEKQFSNSLAGYLKLNNALKPIRNDFDFILIDCPPSLGFFTQNALNASTDVIIPVEAEGMAAKGVNTVMDLITEVNEEVNPDLKILGVLVTNHRNLVVSKAVEEQLRENYTVFNQVIRSYKHYVEASTLGSSIYDYADKNSFKGHGDYLGLAKEVIDGE